MFSNTIQKRMLLCVMCQDAFAHIVIGNDLAMLIFTYYKGTQPEQLIKKGACIPHQCIFLKEYNVESVTRGKQIEIVKSLQWCTFCKC